jgi:Leu/Phe-tRNA-protein transferase
MWRLKPLLLSPWLINFYHKFQVGQIQYSTKYWTHERAAVGMYGISILKMFVY